MRPRIEIKDAWNKMSEQQLIDHINRIRQIAATMKEAMLQMSNEEPYVALIMRYLAQKNMVEARALCDEYLKIRPQNNFFNFARACAEENTAKQKGYLEIAAVSTQPHGDDISAQAAYELARLNYDEQIKSASGSEEGRQALIATEAWFARALMLGHEDAAKHFCTRGNYNEGILSSKMMADDAYILYSQFLMVILAGKQIKGFAESPLLNERLEVPNKFFLSPFRRADATRDALACLSIPGESVRQIADDILALRPRFFFRFFKYAGDVGIISKDVQEQVFIYMTQTRMRLEDETLVQVRRELINLAKEKENAMPLLDLSPRAEAPSSGAAAGFNFFQKFENASPRVEISPTPANPRIVSLI